MRRLIGISLLLALPFSSGIAQESGKSLASTLNVYVFPTDGQAADQQSKDTVTHDKLPTLSSSNQ